MGNTNKRTPLISSNPPANTNTDSTAEVSIEFQECVAILAPCHRGYRRSWRCILMASAQTGVLHCLLAMPQLYVVHASQIFSIGYVLNKNVTTDLAVTRTFLTLWFTSNVTSLGLIRSFIWSRELCRRLWQIKLIRTYGNILKLWICTLSWKLRLHLRASTSSYVHPN